MQVECITRWDELAGLATHWNALARGVPFRSWAWLGGWWRHYGAEEFGNRRLLVLAVYDDANECIGLAPWFTEDMPGRGKVVRFLGSGDVCSDYLSILCLPGREAVIAGLLAQWMCGYSRSGGRSVWNAIELGGVDAGDFVTQRFIDKMRQCGSFVDCRPGPNCWRVELPATWSDYLSLLSKSHRKQVRRLERRLFRSGRAVLRTVVQPADLHRGLDVLADLHGRRRGDFGETGAFADERFTAFHREVTEQLLADDALRLSWIELDGRPVAAEYQVVGNHVVYAYQSGIDPASLDLEPGRLAMMATLRRAIENRFRSFDLLRGDEPYKAHWRGRPRASMEVSIFSSQGADWLKHRARVAGAQFRRWLHENWQRAASLAHVN